MPLASVLRPASVGAMQSAVLLQAHCRFAPGSATSWGRLLLELLYRCRRMYGPESSHRWKSACILAFLWFRAHTWGQLLQEMFGVTLGGEIKRTRRLGLGAGQRELEKLPQSGGQLLVLEPSNKGPRRPGFAPRLMVPEPCASRHSIYFCKSTFHGLIYMHVRD